MASSSSSSADERSVHLLGAVAIGVGGMVGGGIFAVLGKAVELAGGATPVAFAIAGVIAILTAIAYARLSVTLGGSGGTVAFVDAAFDHDLLSGSTNVLLWACYLVTIALYATAFGSYAVTFWPGDPGPFANHVLVSAAIVVPAVLNLSSPALVSRAESVVVAIKLGLLAIVVATGAAYVEPARLAPSTWGDVGSIAVAGLVIFVAYEGFELIANAADDVVDPETTLPRAFGISVVGVLLLYVVIAAVVVGTVTPDKLKAASDQAMAIAAEPALGQAGFTLVSLAAVLATLSAINATIYGNARLGFLLARHGELPRMSLGKVLSDTSSEVVVTAALSLLLANLLDLGAIAILGSAGFLLVFAAANASAFALRDRIGGHPAVYLLGTASCVVALGVLLVRTAKDDPWSVGLFAGMLVVAGVFEVTYGRIVRGRLTFDAPPKDATASG